MATGRNVSTNAARATEQTLVRVYHAVVLMHSAVAKLYEMGIVADVTFPTEIEDKLEEVKQVLIDGGVASLSQRMRNNQVTVGYRTWLDTTDTDHIYITEAPFDADPAEDEVWRGVRIPLTPSGSILGKAEEAQGFTWDNRFFAGWG